MALFLSLSACLYSTQLVFFFSFFLSFFFSVKVLLKPHILYMVAAHSPSCVTQVSSERKRDLFLPHSLCVKKERLLGTAEALGTVYAFAWNIHSNDGPVLSFLDFGQQKSDVCTHTLITLYFDIIYWPGNAVMFILKFFPLTTWCMQILMLLTSHTSEEWLTSAGYHSPSCTKRSHHLTPDSQSLRWRRGKGRLRWNKDEFGLGLSEDLQEKRVKVKLRNAEDRRLQEWVLHSELSSGLGIRNLLPSVFPPLHPSFLLPLRLLSLPQMSVMVIGSSHLWPMWLMLCSQVTQYISSSVFIVSPSPFCESTRAVSGGSECWSARNMMCLFPSSPLLSNDYMGYMYMKNFRSSSSSHTHTPHSQLWGSGTTLWMTIMLCYSLLFGSTLIFPCRLSPVACKHSDSQRNTLILQETVAELCCKTCAGIHWADKTSCLDVSTGYAQSYI